MKSATKVRKKFHRRMTGYGTEDTKPIKSAKKWSGSPALSKPVVLLYLKRLAKPICSHETEHDIRGLCGVCLSCRLVYRDPRAEQQHESGSPQCASGAGASSSDQADRGEPDSEANPISAGARRCRRGPGRAATAAANHRPPSPHG